MLLYKSLDIPLRKWTRGANSGVYMLFSLVEFSGAMTMAKTGHGLESVRVNVFRRMPCRLTSAR